MPPATIDPLLEHLTRSEEFRDSVAHRMTFPGRPASWSPFPTPPLPGPLVDALGALGIERLYSHQAEALDLIRTGRDVLTVTPTASGKSLVYQLPTFEAALRRPGTRSLCIFPYKALAQDQLQGMQELAAAVAARGGRVPEAADLPGAGRPVSAAIYDGDTPDAERRRIKASPPDILITNPDMLHLGLLAHHADWGAFLRSLAFVVVDELHVYKGVFGAHMHHVLQRLLRVAASHGAAPRLIASSATIGNPGGLGEALTGRTFAVVDRSGAPSAEKHLVFLNPAGSPYTAATRLSARALDAGLRTIVFTKARRTTELLHAWLLETAPRHTGRVSAYRSGYLPEERRAIERRLFDGTLRGVIATSALELGVDIGGLDVCVLVGYPGSVVSTWQRMGRVGRGDRPSLTVLVAMPDALDQYVAGHPEAFVERGFEPVVLDPANPIIAGAHLLCAAAELPLRDPEDRAFYGPAVFDRLRALEREGALVREEDGGRWHTLRRRPQRDVGLRGSGATYVIEDETTRRTIGTIDAVRAFHETHTGAIYLHHGRQYLVRELSLQDRRARVVAVDADYYTEVRGHKETEILEVLESRRQGALVASLGRLRIRETITGYERRRLSGRDRLGTHDLDLPPLVFETVGLWMSVPESLRASIVDRQGHFMGGLHAAEHTMIALFPLLAVCDRGDIGGISYPLHPQTGGPAIFIYDGQPGGLGLAAAGFATLQDLVRRTAELIAACRCDAGCPSCIQSPKCGNGNQPLDKSAARLILEVLGGTRPLEGDPPGADAGRVRIVAQEPVSPSPAARPTAGDAGPAAPPAPEPGRGPAPAGREQVLFFDLETQKSADEVGGWSNLGAMKLALAVTWNDARSEFTTHLEKDVDRLLLDLVMADRVIGYNIDRFDLEILRPYTRWDLSKIRTFDMLADIHARLGCRLKLADLAQATLGVGKSADGLQSLRWWREGRVDLIEAYCRRDVEVTRDLYQFGCRNGFVLYPGKDGRSLRLPVVWR